ncbi:hypothetical protein K3152_11745 [Qipengyuania sp. 1NDH17]|uniref:DUF4349 domain-containing protein n=1 Tax=Qipengyuania polymorpha TaxID=2867234 RepID=A0ABS7J333_9SPHN|nr:hypothetical protein [Qipengyuania polymorpha]MBX7458921.1 hypothetical protein [Qipengyuania polymorpha]
MKAVFGWLGRTGLLYLVLCLAFAFYILAWPQIKAEFGDGSLREDAMSVEQVRTALAADTAETRELLRKRTSAFEDESRANLEQRLEEVRSKSASIEARLNEDGGWFDSVRPSRILETKRLELRKAALDAEAGVLTEAIDLAEAREIRARYPQMPTEASIVAATRTCRLWTNRLRDFEAQNPVIREVDAYLRGERERLEAGKTRECGKQQRWTTQRKTALAATKALADAREQFTAAQDKVLDDLPDPAQGIADNTLRDVLVSAAWALLGILLLPYFVRTLLYYVVAPFAARRRSIRIKVPGANRVAVEPPAEQSRASFPVTLGEGEELLVRQGFLQSSPDGASLRTRAMLDWTSPLTSLASGMTFLTRVRGASTTTVISADEDPFAEVTAVDLPQGAAMVLQPRALAAVVQPQDQPLRIESQWRLFNLNAWLTQQLRFLVFHGPARLILKGGRGVRVERVDEGRRFGQDQLAGFSADLAYSVARNETFLPYLFGREPLLRDKVEGGSGILVIEEAPYAGRRKGLRGGLEGAFDAVLKAFGI